MVIIHPHPDTLRVREPLRGPLQSRERESKPSATKEFSFKKEERLLKRVQFLNVTEGGKKLHTGSFIVFTKPNTVGFPRLGLTVSKKVGGAVIRNRIKRIVREFFRLNKVRIDAGIDIVVIAKREAVGKGLREVSVELGKVLFQVSRKPPLDSEFNKRVVK